MALSPVIIGFFLGVLVTLPAQAQSQSVATPPVGVYGFSVAGNSERRLGVTLARPALFASAVFATGENSITSGGALPALPSGAKYVLFTSGQAQGRWFQVSSSTETMLTINGSLAGLGVEVGDKFEVRPFWTLATLFPGGGGLPISSDPFSPSSFLLTYDAAAVGINLAAKKFYFYYDGSIGGDAGWYENGTYQLANDVVISPQTFFALRNNSSEEAQLTIKGDVPATPVGLPVVARGTRTQDNLIYNPYPMEITLGNSGLLAGQVVRPSSNPFSPTDIVWIYPSGSTKLNAAPANAYFYYDGSIGEDAGWYKAGSYERSESVAIEEGAAFLVRKVSGSDQELTWTPPLPYNP